MKENVWRLETGGRIDRSRPLAFEFDGARYSGFAGDTLASALLANGIRIVGRSFKLHRPRGLVGAWCEEPNAIVQVDEGAHTTPNLKATQIELRDGLTARSVNCWPNARRDIFSPLQLVRQYGLTCTDDGQVEMLSVEGKRSAPGVSWVAPVRVPIHMQRQSAQIRGGRP